MREPGSHLACRQQQSQAKRRVFLQAWQEILAELLSYLGPAVRVHALVNELGVYLWCGKCDYVCWGKI